uniref:Bifunctional inhibitor/plant lipid transfer protein/seed storage helical domain-containing protein n=2 Tax=Aegilops tauschii TaxID=37682 RepID=A0A453H3G4_AEGTS|nr:uncharacterized protein LOC120962368 [Aegilops tauschii subsp. strangulata]
METTVFFCFIFSLAVLAVAGGLAQGEHEDPCQPSFLAHEIRFHCEKGAPSARCCRSVVAAVDIAGAGTDTCLCRVAGESGLTTDDLLAMFALCGALSRDGARLNDACGAHSPPAPKTEVISALHQQAELATAVGNTPKATPCDADRLAYELSAHCSDVGKNTGRCCAAVVASVDINNSAETPCLCLVADKWSFLSTGLSLTNILDLYGNCGGRQGVRDGARRRFLETCEW